MTLPPIVDRDTFEAARADLLVKEKAATQVLDALVAERRRLPAHVVDGTYAFGSPYGDRTLLDLFDGGRNLIMYHFSGTTSGPAPGPVPLASRDTRHVVVTRDEVAEQQRLRERSGWRHLPFYSAARTTFCEELDIGAGFALSVFLRDRDIVLRTWWSDVSPLELIPRKRQAAAG
jgi:predicted dithiol-disulfide oxidoreductase (DUF899 family)